MSTDYVPGPVVGFAGRLLKKQRQGKIGREHTVWIKGLKVNYGSKKEPEKGRLSGDSFSSDLNRIAFSTAFQIPEGIHRWVRCPGRVSGRDRAMV